MMKQWIMAADKLIKPNKDRNGKWVHYRLGKLKEKKILLCNIGLFCAA